MPQKNRAPSAKIKDFDLLPNSIDRTVGNCGGLGGLFGIIHALGGSLPFPESKPWVPSLEWEALAKHIPEIGNEWKKITSMFNK